MFSLWEPPKNEIEYEGDVYEYDASFDTALALMELMELKQTSEIVKHETAIEMLFDDERVVDMEIVQQNRLLKEVVKQLFNNGEEFEKRDINGNVVPMPKIKSKKYMSFKYDAAYIYAAFMQTYGIDLHEQFGVMHWHTFLALLDGLSDETQFIKIVNIRKWKKPSKHMTEEQQYRRLKKELALPEEEVD